MGSLTVLIVIIMLALLFAIFVKVANIKSEIIEEINLNHEETRKRLQALEKLINNCDDSVLKNHTKDEVNSDEKDAIFHINEPIETLIFITEEPIEEKSPIIIETETPEKQSIINQVSETKITPLQTKNEDTDPPKPSFFERNPDIEKFIGENLINKIGIAILVLGIGFFVKYAIDQDWINEIGRVFIGLLCGAVLLGIAHKLRNSFRAFSSVLVGGGIAVCYLTIGIAFHEYKLLSQIVAFSLMVVITGFSVLFSIFYNRIELATLSIIGGFVTPFMVSSGDGNYIALFIYLTILNLGMFVLAYFKNWRPINIIAYIFTIILFTGWMFSKLLPDLNGPYLGGLCFVTLFYFIFFFMNIINNIKEKNKFDVSDILMLLSNTFLYYSAGMRMLAHVNEGIYQGLFTSLLAIFNLVFVFVLYKNEKVDRNLKYLLIALVLTFISLVAPIQLKGNYITLFWAAEAVLLLWLYIKSEIKLLQLVSFVVFISMLISLIIDWIINYNTNNTIVLTPFLNSIFITSFVSTTSILLIRYLLKNQNENIYLLDLNIKTYHNFLTLIFVLVIYISFLLEINYQMQHNFVYTSTKHIVLSIYNYLFIAILLQRTIKIKEFKKVQYPFALISAFSVVLYVLFYHWQVVNSRYIYLNKDALMLYPFLLHYTTLIIITIILIFLNSIQKTFAEKINGYPIENYFFWFISIIVTFILSSELDNILLIIKNANVNISTKILQQNHKIGYPILWGIISFALMFIGMKLKKRILRIISLCLFSVTLLKLFIFDIRGVSEGGKILAFISLGILLLTISFMYQKLKKLILENDTKNEQ